MWLCRSVTSGSPQSFVPLFSMPGINNQQTSTEGSLCCPCCPERALQFVLLFSQKWWCVLQKCELFKVLNMAQWRTKWKTSSFLQQGMLLLSLTDHPLTAAGICWGWSSKVGMAEPRSFPQEALEELCSSHCRGTMPSSPSLLPTPKEARSCTSLCTSSH